MEAPRTLAFRWEAKPTDKSIAGKIYKLKVQLQKKKILQLQFESRDQQMRYIYQVIWTFFHDGTTEKIFVHNRFILSCTLIK